MLVLLYSYLFYRHAEISLSAVCFAGRKFGYNVDGNQELMAIGMILKSNTCC